MAAIELMAHLMGINLGDHGRDIVVVVAGHPSALVGSAYRGEASHATYIATGGGKHVADIIGIGSYVTVEHVGVLAQQLPALVNILIGVGSRIEEDEGVVIFDELSAHRSFQDENLIGKVDRRVEGSHDAN